MKGHVKDIYTIFQGAEKELIIPVYQRNNDWAKSSASASQWPGRRHPQIPPAEALLQSRRQQAGDPF